MMCEPTTDHGEILAWAERHNAVPAEVHIRKFDGEPTVLRFLFGKARGGSSDIHPIGWEDFFVRFDLMGLALAYNDTPDFQLLQIDGKSPYHRSVDPF